MNLPHLEWKSNYELGIEDIDFQHHFFLNLINRLSDELKETVDHDYQVSLLSELNAYVRFHFISEENNMRRSNYPRLKEHKKYHHELIDILSFKENMLELHPSDVEYENIIYFLTDWFFHHTAYEDKLFADYLHKKESGGMAT